MAPLVAHLDRWFHCNLGSWYWRFHV